MSKFFESLESRQLMATFTVSNLADAGAGSLRQAIADADQAAGSDVVAFDPGLAGGTIALTSGQLEVQDDLTINGPSASNRLTISGSSASRILHVATGISLTARDLVLTAGLASGSSGGAVLSEGDLSLDNVGVTSSSAKYGGGIAVSGSLSMSRSLVTNNSASLDGGGIIVLEGGSAFISETTIEVNAASGGGGGVFEKAGASLTIESSTLNLNSAAGDGGGIFSLASSATIRNSTVAQNSAGKWGGGIGRWTNSWADVMTVANCTVADNTANSDADGTGVGGGIHPVHGTWIVKSTLVAGNVNGAGSTPDDAAPVGEGFNGNAVVENSLFGDASTSGGITNGQSGNIVGVDPRLVAIGDHGGPTWTYSLSATSPAIGAGSNPLGLTTDQRGGPFSRGTAVDIGSYQRQTLSLMVDNATDAADGDYSSGHLSLREAVALSNVNNGLADSISFAPGITGVLQLSSGLVLSDDATISGPGAGNLSIDGPDTGTAFEVQMFSLTLTGVALRHWSVGLDVSLFAIATVDAVQFSNSINAGPFDGSSGVQSEGTLTIRNSLFVGIQAAGMSSGSGVAIRSTGTLLLENSTITGNSGTLSGAAVLANGTATIRNCTIAENETSGGIEAGGDVTLVSTIVSGHQYWDVIGTLNPSTSSNNLIEDAANAGGLSNGVNGNIVGSDPKLNGLSDNGGATQTLALQSGSPAINAGRNPGSLATDQRGTGFPRTRGSATDIGAYEAASSLSLVVSILSDEDDGNTNTDDLSLREAVRLANENTDLADSITFASTLNGGTIELQSELTSTDDVTITGPGVKLLTIAGEAGLAGTLLAFDSGTTSSVSGLYLTRASVAIRNGGTLTVSECDISGNNATFGANGSIGAGIVNDQGGSLTISNCLISENVATGISYHNMTSPQTGGGVYNAGTVVLRGTTITGNSGNTGGGVYNEGTLSVYNCTIVGNAAVDYNGGNGVGAGGGIYSTNNAVLLVSSIVSGNSKADVFGVTLGSNSANNLIKSSTSAGGLTGGLNGNIIGFDPMLGALTDNGGPTRSFAPLNGSLAVGRGSNPLNLATDQRGMGFARNNQGAVDIGAVESSYAASIVVTVLADEDDGNTGAGDLSLREAIKIANANADNDLVTFASEIAGTITLSGSGLPTIVHPISILGPGASVLAVSGQDQLRIFHIDDGSGTSSMVVAISGLTLTAGRADYGGAILNAEILNVDGVIFDQNHATKSGAGIENNGTITVLNSTFRNNTSEEIGSAITLNTPTASGVTGSTFTGNNSQYGSTIDCAPSVTLTVERCSFTSNNGGLGGAIYMGQVLTVRNSTFYANVSMSYGGAIAMYGGTLVVENSTIVGNRADSTGAGWGQGGGIEIGKADENDVGTAKLVSTILAGNVRGSGAGVPEELAFSRGGSLATGSINNLIQDAATAGGLSNGFNGNIVGVDARIGSLTDGALSLLPGSPAIDKGSNPQNLVIDQRGLARVGGSAIDIGAFESGVFTSTGVGVPSGAADPINTHRIVSRNAVGHLIVFEQGWTVADLQERSGAPAAIGDGVIWVDPKDGLTYVAAPSASGLILFTRDSSGRWSYRNLSNETQAARSPTRDLTQFTSVGGVVVIVGIASDNSLFGFQQSMTKNGTGGWAFVAMDVSAQVTANGGALPVLNNLISYVTSWDAWHLAGIDSDGRIQSVWLHIPGGQVTTWRLDDLSSLTGAMPIYGQLAVTLTTWGGINLTGLDSDGRLLTTWWVPGASWITSDLTANSNGPRLVSGNVSGYTTPWGGLNYVGISEDGTITAYWWAPESVNSAWVASPLLPGSILNNQRPTGKLSSSSSAAGTLNVYGTTAVGDVVRLYWNPGDGSTWALEDVTSVAVKV